MEFLYDFVESIHIFIPIIAVISLVLIVYFCGIGRPEQPSEDLIDRIQKISQKSKKNKAPKPSKFVPPKSSDEDTGKGSARKRQVPKTLTKTEEVAKEAVASPPTPTTKEKWVTVTPKKKGRQGSSQTEKTAEYAPVDLPEPQRTILTTPEKKSSPSKQKNKSKKATTTGENSQDKKPSEEEVEDDGWETQNQKKKGTKKNKTPTSQLPDSPSKSKTQESREQEISELTEDEMEKEASIPTEPEEISGPTATLSARDDGLAENPNDAQVTGNTVLEESPTKPELTLEASLDEGFQIQIAVKNSGVKESTNKKKKKKKGGEGENSKTKAENENSNDLDLDDSPPDLPLKDDGFIEPKKPSRPRARRV